MSDKKNAEKAANDTIAYYERRTGDDGLKSIETRIAKTQQEIEDLTNAFIEARNALLRANIEKKMNEYEILLNDLNGQKSQIKLERGRQITAKDILAFVAQLIKGDPADKDYQRQIIDNLVFMVYIYDDEHIKVVNYFNFGVDKSIERVRLDETNEVLERLKGVQTQSPIVHHSFVKRTRRKVCYVVTDFSFFITFYLLYAKGVFYRANLDYANTLRRYIRHCFYIISFASVGKIQI